MSKKKMITWVLLFSFLLTPFLHLGMAEHVFAENTPADTEQTTQKGIFDRSDILNELIASIIMIIPETLIDLLGLKDVNELVFGIDVSTWGEKAGLPNSMEGMSSMQYGTFPPAIWNAIEKVYLSFESVAGYLLVIALGVWGCIIMFRSQSADAMSALKGINAGFLIYIIGGLMFGRYIIKTVFEINYTIIRFAESILNSEGIYVTHSFFYTVIQLFGAGSSTAAGAIKVGADSAKVLAGQAGRQALMAVLPEAVTIGLALLIAALTIFVAIINYQYAIRLVWLSIYIAIFPICAYAAIFPSTRRAFETWVREFSALVLTQGMQAVFLALFFIFLKTA